MDTETINSGLLKTRLLKSKLCFCQDFFFLFLNEKRHDAPRPGYTKLVW